MDPVSVLKTLWRHKLVMFPVLLITLVAGAYIFFLAPRTYSSTATYALVNPKVPSAEAILKDPALSKLNADNPYLRSSDNSLLTQVLITKLGSAETVSTMHSEGHSADFTVAPTSAFGAAQLIQITATGSSPAQAETTASALGDLLVTQLRTVQKINGADDLYLFTPLQVEPPSQAKEQFSSRLRSLIMVGAGGVILLFSAVSVARALESSRQKRRDKEGAGFERGTTGAPTLSLRRHDESDDLYTDTGQPVQESRRQVLARSHGDQK